VKNVTASGRRSWNRQGAKARAAVTRPGVACRPHLRRAAAQCHLVCSIISMPTLPAGVHLEEVGHHRVRRLPSPPNPRATPGPGSPPDRLCSAANHWYDAASASGLCGHAVAAPGNSGGRSPNSLTACCCAFDYVCMQRAVPRGMVDRTAVSSVGHPSLAVQCGPGGSWNR